MQGKRMRGESAKQATGPPCMPESVHAPRPVKQPSLTRKFRPTCLPVSWPRRSRGLLESGAWGQLSASLATYDIADVRPLFGEGRA